MRQLSLLLVAAVSSVAACSSTSRVAGDEPLVTAVADGVQGGADAAPANAVTGDAGLARDAASGEAGAFGRGAGTSPQQASPELVLGFSNRVGLAELRLVVIGDRPYLVGPYGVSAVAVDGGRSEELARIEGFYAPPRSIVVGAGSLTWTAGGATIGRRGDGRFLRLDLATKQVTQVAQGLESPCSAISVDGEMIWIDHEEQQVLRAKAGGGRRRLGGMPRGYEALTRCVANLGVDDRYLYFGVANVVAAPHSGAVVRMPLGGGRAEVIAARQWGPSNVVVDATHLYWANTYGGPIVKLSRAGGAPEELVAAARLTSDLVLGGEYLYWVELGIRAPYSIRRISRNGGDVEILYTGDERSVFRLALGTDHIYWVASGHLEGECRTEYPGCGQNPMPPEEVCDGPGFRLLRLPLH